MEKLADALRDRQDESRCELKVTSGVVVSSFWDKEGTQASMCIGVTPISVLQHDKARLGKLVDLLVKKVKQKQIVLRAKKFDLVLA
jgi:hypothetical protein